VSAVSFRDVSFAYPDAARAAVRDVDLEVAPGELLLVLGASGSGKSTLLRAVNGLVPHTSGGRFGGDVVVFGRSTRSHHPRELADVVGFVAQDPESQSVVDHVERDLAFVLENLGFSQEAMRRRVEEVLDALGIAHLRDRDPSTLSGGERQRCAIAGALAAGPQALVLDEHGAVGEWGRAIEPVFGEHHGGAEVGVQARERVEHVVGALRVELRRGFVEHQRGRRGRERAGDGAALPFTT